MDVASWAPLGDGDTVAAAGGGDRHGACRKEAGPDEGHAGHVTTGDGQRTGA